MVRPRKVVIKPQNNSQVKTLDPRDPDTKYFGSEPEFNLQPEPESRVGILARSFTWYNRFYGKKDAKDLLLQYLELKERKEEAKTIKKIDESSFNMTVCWLARLELRGLVLSEHESSILENEISKLVDLAKNPQQAKQQSMTGGAKKEETPVKESNRPNVQEIMRDKAREAAGEIEGLFDDYIAQGAPTKFSVKILDEVAKKNVMPQHINIIVDTWKKKKEEFELVQQGKDKQLSEAYGHYTKTQIKNLLKFADQVLTDLNSYVSVKKANKAPRKRKAVPVEKLVSKLKFLKAFKDDALKLDLVSLHPVKLHGSSEAWVFDTSKRKLHHYVADEYSKTLSVKGNTLLGFDSNKSEVKTLRKPAEQLKEIMGSKPAARKYFNEIKAVSVSPTGRFNESMIILRAF